MFLTDEVKLIKVKDHSAAGTSEVDSAGVDMEQDGGYDGVIFFTSFGTAAADNYANLQQSDDDGSSDGYSDLAGTKLTTGASPSNEDIVLDILRPQKRYVRCKAMPTTSSTVESIWALLYRSTKGLCVNSVSGTLLAGQFLAPAEGTA